MRDNDHTVGSLPAGNVISYRHSDGAQMQMIAELGRLMDQGARSFCDVGGGANPIVSERKISQLGLDYVILDGSEQELAKAPASYSTFQASMLDRARISELLAARGGFDVVASRWTAEHMPDGESFHAQVFEMLKPGGAAVHLFPTLYAPPFVLNRVLPDGLSERLLSAGSRGGRASEGRHAKFRSYYSWCRGPSAKQLRRLRGAGFAVERYVGYFGHGYYRRLGPVQTLHRRLTSLLLEHPVASMTSFSLIVLRRPR